MDDGLLVLKEGDAVLDRALPFLSAGDVRVLAPKVANGLRPGAIGNDRPLARSQGLVE